MASVFEVKRRITRHGYVVIDNGIFSLHYGITAFVLVLFSVIAICNVPGESLTCSKENGVPPKFLNAFCNLRRTSNQENAWQQENSESGFLLYNKHNYFQVYDEWFSFLYLFQAFLFIAPRYFWKFMESGKVGILVTLLYSTGNSREANIKQVSDIVYTGAKGNKKYLLSYFAAEFLNALNASFCIVILAVFFDRPTMDAVDVLEFAGTDWSPCWEGYCRLGQNFPMLSPCTINKYTSSGEVTSQKAAIILPTYIIYQKIAIFLFYWFHMLSFLSYAILCYRMCLIISPFLRVKMLKMRCRKVNPADLALINRALGLENWFLINLLSKNIDAETFTDFTVVLANKIRNEMNRHIPESDLVAY